jgi:hypothetical protein
VLDLYPSFRGAGSAAKLCACGRPQQAAPVFHSIRALAHTRGNFMFTMRRLLPAFALILAAVAFAAPGQAATLLHTWVSNSGNDSSSCDITAPCATFVGAIDKTSSGGEVTCLNSGDYGSGAQIIISQPINIDCEYSIGSPTVSGGSSVASFSIEITSGDVTLRGLDLDFGALNGPVGCLTGGGQGILINGGGTVHLEKMKMNQIGRTGCGILFDPSSNETLDITDCDITDNGSSGTAAGIYIQPQSGVQANITITRTQVQGNQYGIVADGTAGGTIRGTISDSVVSGNAQNGITVSAAGSGGAVLIIDQTKVSGNGNHGLAAAGSGAGMLVRNTSVFNNTGGGLFTESGATLYSYGNNSVNGNNGNDGSFTGTIGLK